MKGKFKRLTSFFMALLVLLGSVVTNFGATSVFANDEIYEGYKINKKDVTSDQTVPFMYVKPLNGGKTESVYCFNLHYIYPPTEGENPYPKYNKVEANAEKMHELAENKNLSGDELKDAILKVIYYGDSENGDKKIKKEYGLSDEQFHLVTQKAIWHFTDRGDSQGLDNRAKQAYEELIKVDSKTLPAGIKLNIYTTTDISEKENKQYQNLLSAKILNSDGSEHTPEKKISIRVVKGWSDQREESKHPEIKIALMKGDEQVDVKTLPNTESEVVFDNLDAKDFEKYKVFELDDHDEKIDNKKKGTISGRIFEVTYLGLNTKDDSEYIAHIQNTEWADIKVTKKWEDSKGQELKKHNYTTEITASMPEAKPEGYDYHEKKGFSAETTTNHYMAYSEAVEKFNILFQEKGDDGNQVDLEIGKGKDVVIGGKTFTATLTKNANDNYIIVNKEKQEVPKEEKVTLKAKKTWDGKKQESHPETYFALFKDHKIVDGTIKKLEKNKDEVAWTDIKKADYKSYLVRETDDNGKPVEKYVTLDGKTYEAVPQSTTWENDGEGIYSFTINNQSFTVVTVDKEWKNKAGGTLKDESLKTTISVKAGKDKDVLVKEDKYFDSTTSSNKYYIPSALEKLAFEEENILLKGNEGVEVKIGNRTFIATLTKTDENYYKVTNQEKPDEELVTLKAKKTWDGKEEKTHPETYFALFKENKLVDKTVKKLEDGKTEVVWENIKKDDYKSYTVRETDKDGKAAGKYTVLDGKNYEVIYKGKAWVEEAKQVYSVTVDNSLRKIITIDKEWKDKDGKELKNHKYNTVIYLDITDAKGEKPLSIDRWFDAKDVSNKYYIPVDYKISAIDENRSAILEENKTVEVELSKQVFLVTLTKMSDDHYKVTNQEKPDKPVKPTNTKIKFSKQDIAGKELKDATIKLTHADGTSEEWKSDGSVHEFTVKEGKYTFTETSAPDGYLVSTDITFEVTYNKDKNTLEITNVKTSNENKYENGIFVMVDDYKKFDVLFSKVAVNGSEELKDANLKVVKGEKADGELVKQWMSTENQEKISLVAGTYTMVETTAPKGYKVAENITFRVTKDGKVEIKDKYKWVAQKDSTVKMEDALEDKPITPLTPAKTSLKVEKEWKGMESKDAPEVTVYLVKNKVKTDKFIKLNKDNNWQGEFKDLDVVDNIKEAQANKYTVVEDGEKDGKVTIGDTEYKVAYIGGKVVNTKVTPQMPLTPAKTSLKVEKEWKGIEVNKAPEVIIYLVKNGVKTDKFIKLNKDNNWQGEFTNLDVVDDIKDKKANVYTIVEDGEINSKIVLDGTEYKVTYVGGKVVNTKVEKPVKPEQPKDPQKPGEPKKPETPGKKTPDSPKSNTPKNLPKTGDNSNIGMFVGLLALSAGALTILGVYRKRKMR
ncbi:TPA: thioester-forming surface-anchored protein [Streptococcus equi subsp. zooepidemicus]|nr:thioester-forming surface-anchored protein [Streptococcus equi subsp. zooepidemicus]HEL0343664.1 thioester-forming surface-anchored protein [Streptococcus equi subsp. zooepidemicus]HEL0347864.1 thioester-forming surface-anchored protein [Streptococcus equi subsp. zooepidemicus]HEL0349765.1 thioester-forming surface-anchored protein [Streptococcus equi subsp. zooepidemicus]